MESRPTESSEIQELKAILPMALYKVDELATLLRVSNRTIRRYCALRVFSNATKVSRKQWLIPGCDVLSFFPQLSRGDEIEDYNLLDQQNF